MPGPGHKLVLASGNAGKLAELRNLLVPLGWQVHAQSDWNVPEAIEDGLSFVENSLIKARHASKHTGLPALADDSGLVVDALNGQPGIHSARFAGADATDELNNQRLLKLLEGFDEKQRSAHFYCAITLVSHENDPVPIIATARWDGYILNQARGDGGFGYDPLFYVPDQKCASAELPREVKNGISHRGQALSVLLQQIQQR